MNPMLTILLSGLAGLLAGAVSGRFAASHAPSPTARSQPVDDVDTDREVDDDIALAASAWARTNGQSDAAAALVANKLRLAHRLQERRLRRSETSGGGR